MGGWKGEEAEGGEAGKAAAAAGGGEAQGGSPRPRAPRLPGTHQTANGCAEVYSRWRPTAPFLPPPPLRPPPLPSVLRLPDAGMGGLPTHTTIFLALGKLRARRLPEAAAAAPARRVSAAALRPERGMPSPWPARERAGSGPGWGGGVRRGQTLLSAPWAASFTPSPGQTWELASGASPTPLRGGCKVRRARALADGDTPSGDLGRDLRRRDQAMRLGHEEPCSRTSSLLWGLLMKGTRGPSSCAGSLGAQDWRAGSSAGFANRLTEGSLSVVLTVKSARGRSLPLEDS